MCMDCANFYREDEHDDLVCSNCGETVPDGTECIYTRSHTRPIVMCMNCAHFYRTRYNCVELD